MADLRAGLQNASEFLYDFTDGQMVLEEIEIVDDGHRWMATDMRILVSSRQGAPARVRDIDGSQLMRARRSRSIRASHSGVYGLAEGVKAPPPTWCPV